MLVKSKRIFFIGSFLSRHYATKALSETVSELLRFRGWDVITASSHPGRLSRLTDMVRQTWNRRKDYDIAHVDVFSGPAFSWAELVTYQLQVLRKPFLLTLRGGKLPAFAERWPNRVRNLLTRANLVTTPSYYLMEELGRFRDDIQYLPNGLDLQGYPFQLREFPEPKMGWLRAFSEVYNPTMAVEVLALLQKSCPDIQLTMFGPHRIVDQLEIVKNLANEKGVLNKIHFPGAVPKVEVPQELQKHDIFINTTRYESFGVAVMEAAALGLPIVTTNVGELPYLWTDGEDALLVPSEDAGAMAGAIKRVLSEPGLAEWLSHNARAKAEGYDWSSILPQWENLIQEVLDSA